MSPDCDNCKWRKTKAGLKSPVCLAAKQKLCSVALGSATCKRMCQPKEEKRGE